MIAGVAAAGFAVFGTVALMGAFAIAVCLAPIGPRRLSTVQFAAVYVTRYRAGFGPFRLLPEQLVAVVMLVSAVVTGQLRAAITAARSKPMVLTAAFIGWGACVSVLASPDPVKSLGIAVWLGLSWLIAVNLIAFGGSSARLQRQLVVWGGVAAWIALVMYACDRLLGTGIALQPEFNTGREALHGVAWEANILASTLAGALFLAVSARREVISRRTLWLTVPPMLVAVFMALTRGAVLGLALGLVVWTAMSGGRALRRLVAWFAMGALLVGAVAIVSPATLRPVEEKLSLLVDTSSGTGKGRIDLWETALHDIHGHSWVLGLGLNSFGQRHLDPTRPDDPTPAYLGSLPLQVLYDTGLVGALLLAGALVSVWPRDRTTRRRAIGLLVVVLISTTATSTLWFGSTWALIAMAAQSRAEWRASRPPTASRLARRSVSLSGSR